MLIQNILHGDYTASAISIIRSLLSVVGVGAMLAEIMLVEQ